MNSIDNNDNVLYLTSEVPPSINNDYLKPRAVMIHGKPMSMMYETKKAKDYKKKFKKHIKEEVKKQGFVREDGKYVMLEWTFYFARSNQDTNNYLKVPIDSITDSEMIWKDDNLSMNTDVDIFYDSKNPHVEIKLYYLDKIGIFKNQDELDLFVDNNCSNCKKGNKIGQKGGCSFYKKALENRIQDEIDMEEMECSVRKPV